MSILQRRQKKLFPVNKWVEAQQNVENSLLQSRPFLQYLSQELGGISPETSPASDNSPFYLVVSMSWSKYHFSKLSISESSGVDEITLLEILLSFVVECV